MRTIFIKWQGLFFSVLAALLTALFLTGLCLEYWEEQQLAAIPEQPANAPTGQLAIVIKIPSRILELHADGQVYKRYRIAVGKNETPSPIGEWVIVWKSYRSGDIFGTRFLALNVPWGGYGIHGTNRPWSIGQFASQGCIRMRNKDVEELFEWVPVGTPVRIEGRALRIERTLKMQMMGPDVVLLQARLRQLGYLEGRADGFFNRDTDEAVRRFQHDKGHKPSGIVDQKTLDLLGL